MDPKRKVKLRIKLNKRFLWLGEKEIDYIIDETLKAIRIDRNDNK